MDADLEPAPAAADPAPDAVSRLLATAGVGLGVLALVEIAGTIAVGLAVTTQRLGFAHRQGYAFLTQLEKSPVALLVVVAVVLAAVALLRAGTDATSARLARVALWVAVGAAAAVGVGAILAVLARFRIAELTPRQPIDAITRRVLFSFVVRNFGAAVLALLLAFGALFRPTPAPDAVA